jgi:hypothetical protein
MAYQSGFRHCRVTIANKVVDTTFGETTSYEEVKTVWANKGWKHGMKALQEGALDVYDKVLFRTNWNNIVRRDSILVCEGKKYQVLSLDGEFKKNEIEILAQELVNQQIVITKPVVAEIWGNQAMTTRPSGMVSTMYVQFKRAVSKSVTLTNTDGSLSVTFDQTNDQTTIVYDQFKKQMEGVESIAKNTVVTLAFSPPVPGGQPPMMNPGADYTFRQE